MYLSYVASLNIEKNVCSGNKNCTTCTKKSLCSWSLEKQSCADKKSVLGCLLIHDETRCPNSTAMNKWSVANKKSVNKYETYDVSGFVPYFRKINIKCCYDNNSCNSSEFDFYLKFYTRSSGTLRNVDCVVCTWSTDKYSYFLKMCGRKLQQGTKSATGDLVAVEKTVELECPDIRIRSVEPLLVPWTGGVRMTIAVQNNRFMMGDNSTVIVTVADRSCANATAVDAETISCTVANGTGQTDGPVVVAYVAPSSSPQQFKLVSDATVKFVDPEITGVRPVCGPAAGDTVVTVTGRFLDAGRAVTVSVGGNRTCDTIERTPDRITCRTAAGDEGAAAGRVSVTFDGPLVKYGPADASFAYARGPAVVAGQPLAGIAAGGTSVRVRGHGFSCAERPLMYVELDDGVTRTADCEVHADDTMACRTPRIGAKLGGSVTLKCGFRMDYAGSPVQLDSPAFVAYPDPVFAGFEVDGNRSVVIDGRDLTAGYHVDDLTVRPANSTDECVVTLFSESRIRCQFTSPDVDVDHLHVVVVSIGSGFVDHVVKHPNRCNSQLLTMSSISVHVVVTVVISTVILCLGCALTCFIMKRKHANSVPDYVAELHFAPNSLSRTELEPDWAIQKD